MAQPSSLRLLSLNINCRSKGFRAETRTSLGQVLADTGPDLIVLTEFTPTKGNEQLVLSVLHEMGWSLPLVSPSPKQNRVLIASRWPLKQGDMKGPEQIPSIFLHAHVAELELDILGFRPIIKREVTYRKVKHLPEPEQAAKGCIRPQIKWLVQGPAATLANRNVVLTGDFNAQLAYAAAADAEDRGVDFLQGLMSSGWKSAEDPRSEAMSFPAPICDRRIDHTFLGPACKWEVARCRYLCSTDSVASDQWISDHAAMLVDLRAPLAKPVPGR